MDISVINKSVIILFTTWTLKVFSNDEIKESVLSTYFEQGSRTTFCGHIVPETNAGMSITCSFTCLLHKFCKGIAFNAEAHHSERCKLITSHTGTHIDQTQLINNGYTQYSIKNASPTQCSNIGSISIPPDWRSGCPRLYFPLDQMSEGTALGPHASTISFTNGKINNSLHFPNPTGDMKAYFSLGYYPSTSWCLPEPERCPEGVTFAFWLKIHGTTGGYQGFISTIAPGGPGFIAGWHHGYNGLYFEVLRNSDTIAETVRMNHNNFVSLYGFGMWVHYIVTYKANSGIDENNVEVYFNGQVQYGNSWKHTTSWYHDNTLDYDGRLELGLSQLGNPYWAPGNMDLDDLIIWERQIPCDDAFRLYQAYNV